MSDTELPLPSHPDPSLGRLLKHEGSKHTGLEQSTDRNLTAQQWQERMEQYGQEVAAGAPRRSAIIDMQEIRAASDPLAALFAGYRRYFNRENQHVVDEYELLAQLQHGEAASKIIAAFVVVLDDKGRILLGERVGQGYYNFPGGKSKWGEPIAVAARREVLEETNLELGPLKLITTNENDDWFAMIYAAQALNPDHVKDLEPTKQRGFTFYDTRKTLPSPLFSIAEQLAIDRLRIYGFDNLPIYEGGSVWFDGKHHVTEQFGC